MGEDGDEKLSKNELKRRQKAEKKAAEKAEKESKKAEEAAANSDKTAKPKINEEEISPNEYFKIRSLAVEDLKKTDNHPYPHKFDVTTSLTHFIESYSSLEAGQTLKVYDRSQFPVLHLICRTNSSVYLQQSTHETEQLNICVNFTTFKRLCSILGQGGETVWKNSRYPRVWCQVDLLRPARGGNQDPGDGHRQLLQERGGVLVGDRQVTPR